MIDRKNLEKTKEIWKKEPILNLKPFINKKVGIITTGSEVFHNRIKDEFTPVVKSKVEQYNSSVLFHKVCDDDLQQIKLAINEGIDNGCDFILCTGGMSVDPDDMTPGAIKESGVEVVSYGSPMLPGSMFLISYLDNIPILGLPGCVMYMKTTVFDVILPYILTDTPVTKEIIASLGYGGYCLNCDICYYPNCQFGKGI